LQKIDQAVNSPEEPPLKRVCTENIEASSPVSDLQAVIDDLSMTKLPDVTDEKVQNAEEKNTPVLDPTELEKDSVENENSKNKKEEKEIKDKLEPQISDENIISEPISNVDEKKIDVENDKSDDLLDPCKSPVECNLAQIQEESNETSSHVSNEDDRASEQDVESLTTDKKEDKMDVDELTTQEDNETMQSDGTKEQDTVEVKVVKENNENCKDSSEVESKIEELKNDNGTEKTESNESQSDVNEENTTKVNEESTNEKATSDALDDNSNEISSVNDVTESIADEETHGKVNFKPIKLNFMRKFATSVGKLSRSELEDLVLQKITESLVFRSQYTEFRTKIEKCEEVIHGLKRRIEALTKQYNDLDMIHARVVRDLKERPDGPVTPVKITRAVGLQVYQPQCAVVKSKSGLQGQLAVPTTSSAIANKRPSSSDLNGTRDFDGAKKKKAGKIITPMRPPLSEKEQASLMLQEKINEQQIRTRVTKSDGSNQPGTSITKPNGIASKSQL
jgi:hypothetical protein